MQRILRLFFVVSGAVLLLSNCQSAHPNYFGAGSDGLFDRRGIIGGFWGNDELINNEFTLGGFQQDAQLINFTGTAEDYSQLVRFKRFHMVCLPKDGRMPVTNFRIPDRAMAYKQWLDMKPPVTSGVTESESPELKQWEQREPMNDTYRAWKQREPAEPNREQFDGETGSPLYDAAMVAYQKQVGQWQQAAPENPFKTEYEAWWQLVEESRAAIRQNPENFAYCMPLTPPRTEEAKLGWVVLDPIAGFFEWLVEGVRGIFVSHADSWFSNHEYQSIYVIFEVEDIKKVVAWFKLVYGDKYDPRYFVFPPFEEDVSAEMRLLQARGNCQVEANLESTRLHRLSGGIGNWLNTTAEVEVACAATTLQSDGSLPDLNDAGYTEEITRNEVAEGIVDIVFQSEQVNHFLDKFKEKVKLSDALTAELKSIVDSASGSDAERVIIESVVRMLRDALEQAHQDPDVLALLDRIPYQLGDGVAAMAKALIEKYARQGLQEVLARVRAEFGGDTVKQKEELVARVIKVWLAFLSSNRTELKNMLAVNLSRFMNNYDILRDEVKYFRRNHIRSANHLFYARRDGVRPPKNAIVPNGMSPALDLSAPVFDRELDGQIFRQQMSSGFSLSFAVVEKDDTKSLVQAFDLAQDYVDRNKIKIYEVPLSPFVTAGKTLVEYIGRDDVETMVEDIRFANPTQGIVQGNRRVKSREQLLPLVNCRLVTLRDRQRSNNLITNMGGMIKEDWACYTLISVRVTESNELEISAEGMPPMRVPAEAVLPSLPVPTEGPLPSVPDNQ